MSDDTRRVLKNEFEDIELEESEMLIILPHREENVRWPYKYNVEYETRSLSIKVSPERDNLPEYYATHKYSEGITERVRTCRFSGGSNAQIFQLKDEVLSFAFNKAVEDCKQAVRAAYAALCTREEMINHFDNGEEHWEIDQKILAAAKDNPILKEFGIDVLCHKRSTVEDFSPDILDPENVAVKMGWGTKPK